MTMRISTPFMFARGVDMMLKKQVSLSDTELQLASGKRILRPSDDPSASVRILDLKETQSKLEQFQRNAEAAKAKLGQEEAALTSVQNLLQRVRELAVAGNNDTYSTENRTALAKEIREHLGNFLQLANTRDANGEYIFAGYQTNTPPMSQTDVGLATYSMTYSGDSGQRVVMIGESREVAMGDPGSIFMEFAANAGGTTNVGEVLNNIVVNFEAGNGDANALTDLDTALGEILNTRALIGARMNAIDEQKTANDSFDIAVNQVRSTLEDLDYAEAVSRFNQQLTALQASQQSFLKIQDLNLFNFLR